MSLVMSRGFVEEVIARIHAVEPARRPALAARLRHLQRLGFPPGINTGKGKRAEYGLDELLLLAAAFELLQLGVTPERVSTVLIEAESIVISEAKAAVRALTDVGAQRLLLIDPRSLSSLQGSEAADDDHLMVGSLGDVRKRFLSKPTSSARIAIVDLMNVVVLIADAVWYLSPDTDPVPELTSWATNKKVERTVLGARSSGHN